MQIEIGRNLAFVIINFLVILSVVLSVWITKDGTVFLTGLFIGCLLDLIIAVSLGEI